MHAYIRGAGETVLTFLNRLAGSPPTTSMALLGVKPPNAPIYTTRKPVLASPEPLVFLVNLQNNRSYWCSWSTCSSTEVIGVHGQLAIVVSKL